MTEKNVTIHIIAPHSLVLFLRPRSSVWQCRYQVDGKWQRQSTKQYELDKARAAAHDLLVEAIYRGYMFEINRPKLVALGKKSERRPAFSLEKVRALRANFDSWILKGKADSVELRSLLRDYVTILLDTGMRPGTEVAELTWGQIEIKYYPVATKTGEIDRDHSRIESNILLTPVEN